MARDKDRLKNRPLCHCGQPRRTKGLSVGGTMLWARYCWRCSVGGYRAFKKSYCEHCGFVALHPVQLDVDHINGDRTNNDESNLQTLCANCHRLKTQLNQDYLPYKPTSNVTITITQQMGFDFDA